MNIYIEILKFIIYCIFIVVISKYLLVNLLRKLAETLNLKPKIVGNIAGVATSVPELLTITFSSFAGLIDTSVFNIISSNIINFVQYIFSLILNKNWKLTANKAIRIDIFLVISTIIIPTLLIIFNIELSIFIIPAFILLLILFYFININAHKLYLKRQENKIEKEIINEAKWLKGKSRKIIRYSIFLLLTSILLFVIGNLLSETLENLCLKFNISQIIIGITLGFITSLPELITFFESQKHYKKENDDDLGVVEATNNLLTSNVLNLFVIQSIGILIYTIFS